MINCTPSAPVEKLSSQTGTVWEGKEGWGYAHHASITFFRGTFYAVWSNGIRNEDDCGQRVLLATSEDGLHWSDAVPVVTPELLGRPRSVCTAAGFHIANGALYLHYGCYDYKPECLTEEGCRPATGILHTNTVSGYRRTEDGIHWSDPVDLHLSMIPNQGPEQIRSGRWIIGGNVAFPYTDDPNGASGYRMTGIYGNAFPDGNVTDDSETIHRITKVNGWDARLICESSFYQTDDGVIHMMLRSNSDRMWVSESRDDGATWSAPQPTQFPSDDTKFHFGRLPDGRFYTVCNATPKNHRLPLHLCLSRDGETFDRQYILRDEPCVRRIEGLHKGGHYGYPHSLVCNGFMYVIYSKFKEDIEVTRFALDQL